MSAFRAVIFDLDGVLVHTDVYHYRAWKTIADRLELRFDEEVNNRLRGVSRSESFEIILRHNGRIISSEEKTAAIGEKNDIYRASLAEMTPESLDSGVLDTLVELKNRGLWLAIGSSSRNARFILERTDISELFDAISDGTNISRSKPDPEVFLKAAGYLGLDSRDCLVVEDAEAGVDAAIAGGFRCAAIGDAVRCGRADVELTQIADILPIVD